MEKSKVFIPMVPSRIDKVTNVWVPTVDLSAAAKYGELVTLLPPEAGRLHTVPLMNAIRERMSEFSKHDYIIAIGDPTILAAVACVAHLRAGLLRILKWDRQSQDYIAMEFRP